MLHPKIIEVRKEYNTGHTYVLVLFWRSKAARGRSDPPYLIEDFLMQLRPTGTRVIDEGNPLAGSEAFNRDLPAEIKENIRSYIVRAEKFDYHGDNSSKTASGGEFFAKGRRVRAQGLPITSIERDNSDPHGVLLPEVVAMRGRNVDVT